MDRKQLVWAGFFIGSAVGAYVPYLWGDTSFLSMGSVIMSALCGALGIWLGFKLGS